MNQATDWLSRWQRGQIGFHRSSVHPLLRAYWRTLQPTPGGSTLVPMCGKSLDVAWLLKQGSSVTAIDISPIAIENLVQEQGVLVRRRVLETHSVFETDRLRALCGDFFRIGEMELDSFQTIYDRAGFGAMAPSLRALYVASTLQVCAVGTRILLTVLEYQEHETRGPPFSLSLDEVRRCYGEAFSIEELARIDVLATDQRMRDRGVTSLEEVAYRLERLPT